jgi:prepilin-type N-terminal cleavage/methylation domain
MLRLNKKGYTIIEITIAIMIFSILILCSFNIEYTRIQVHAYAEKKENYLFYLEKLKNRLVNNIDYDALNYLYKNNRKYINSRNLTVDALNNTNISELLENQIKDNNNFLEIVLFDNIPAKVGLQLHANCAFKNEVIKIEFTKGIY